MCLSCLGGWWVPQLQGRRRRKLPGLLLLLHQSHAAVACDAAPLSAHGTMDSSPVLAHTRNKTMCAHMSAPIPHKLRVVLGSVDLIVRDDVQVQTDRQTDTEKERQRQRVWRILYHNSHPCRPIQANNAKAVVGIDLGRRKRSGGAMIQTVFGSHLQASLPGCEGERCQALP